jgi:hypothetical protein
MVGQVEPQRRDRDVSALERPQVCTRSVLAQLRDGEPEDRAVVGIARRHDLTVVLLDGLAHPVDATRTRGQVHVDETQLRPGNQQLEDALDVRGEIAQVRGLANRGRAEGDAARAQQGRLVGRRERPRVPHAVAQVGAQVDAGQDHVHIRLVVHSERDAVGRRPVDPVRLDPLYRRRTPVRKWSRGGDGVAGR